MRRGKTSANSAPIFARWRMPDSSRPPSRRTRLDRLVVERGLASSRERAQALIAQGHIALDGHIVTKPSTLVPGDARVERRGEDHPFVGRGGIKPEAALAAFALDPAGWICLDVGASTGGFTDCLLRHGARRVYAIDVGSGQLDPRLRADPRVMAREQCDGRRLRRADFAEAIDLITVDVSFISATLLLPALAPLLRPGGTILVLVKPQFEAGRAQIGKRGVVRSAAARAAAVARVRAALAAAGLQPRGEIASPILGGEGNQEFFLRAER